jgi:hypothetical protein
MNKEKDNRFIAKKNDGKFYDPNKQKPPEKIKIKTEIK